jgi:hypothetical protein
MTPTPPTTPAARGSDYWKDGERPRPAPPIPANPVGVYWLETGVAAPQSLAEHFALFLRSPKIADDPDVIIPLRRVAAGTPVEPHLADAAALLGRAAFAFEKIVAEWSAELKQLLEAYEALPKRDPGTGAAKRQANAIRQQMRLLGQVTVIESLADRQFLPRYGFPIGLQRLRVEVAERDADG